jgi:hypothetical protein
MIGFEAYFRGVESWLAFQLPKLFPIDHAMHQQASEG